MQKKTTRRQLLAKAIGYGTGVGLMGFGLHKIARQKGKRQAMQAAIPKTSKSLDLRFREKPSISISTISRVLAETPMHGKGALLEKLALKYNIDPAFALGFFQHESGFCSLGIGAKNNNPGNLRLPNSKTGFQKFATIKEGTEAWFRLIANGTYYYKKGRFTLEEIVPVYAPPNENATRRYIESVRKSVEKYRQMEKAK